MSYPNCTLIQHPVAEHALTVLRDVKSVTEQFRVACKQVVPVLLIEATKNLPLRSLTVTTPLCEAECKVVANDVVIVPILRAGLTFLSDTLDVLPFAKIGYLGMARDETTAKATTYYKKLPNIEGSTVIIVDPMLATGGSLVRSLEVILPLKPRSVCIASIVSAPEGIKLLGQMFPEVHIYTTAIDKCLNERKFIVPGLGDFGDRFNGTIE